MKKIILSLTVLMSIVGTGTSFGKTNMNPRQNNSNTPKKEIVQNQRQENSPETKGNTYQMTGKDMKQGSCKKSKCNCKECQKKSKKHIGKHQVQVRQCQTKQHRQHM